MLYNRSLLVIYFIYSSVYIGEGNGTPLQYSCLECPMDGGPWWAAVHGVAKSRTRLSDFPFIFHFHALEKEMATHSSVLAWRIPGMGESGGLPSMGSHRVGHDWSDLAVAAAAVCIWQGGHGNPLRYSYLENPHGQRSLAGCSPGGCKESGTTERLSTAQHSTVCIWQFHSPSLPPAYPLMTISLLSMYVTVSIL